MTRIRVGIGGWTYEPWRDNFYPAKLPASRELQHASRQVTAIEVNGTYYSTMTAKSFERWFAETPDDFVFSLKANRFATNRRVLAEAGESIARFVNSGLARLEHKLGPLLWQFADSKKFDPVDFEAFLKLLPEEVDGRKLRHVLDVRNDSFMTPEFLALARRYRAAVVFTDSPKFPSFANLTTDFVYLRLMNAQPDVPTGYAPDVLAAFASCAQAWAGGAEPAGLPLLAGDAAAPASATRDVFVFMINGAKERAPAAAMAMLDCLRG
jgi:uncharacterized protein YecE (DUF72 family)